MNDEAVAIYCDRHRFVCLSARLSLKSSRSRTMMRWRECKTMTFLRQYLQTVPGYTPGEQPPPGSPVIKLNTNENPYPPSPDVLQALQNLDGEWIRRYPDPTAIAFRQAASEVLQVPANWITVGNGSDELISLLMRAVIDPGDKVVYSMPSYVLYRTVACLQQAKPIEIAYDADFNFPLSELIAAQGKITFVATPNSPSGHCVSLADLETLANAVSGLLVIDEAYTDFAEQSALHLVHTHPNVVILRTLSKGYSLAGLRFGFVIAHPDLIQGLNKIKDSYAVDAIAMRLATAAIRDQDYKNWAVAQVRRSRTTLSQQLQALGFRVWPSQGNFLMVQPPAGHPALDLQQALKANGILVRHFNLPGVADKLRISIGTEDQNGVLCRHLSQLLQPSVLHQATTTDPLPVEPVDPIS